MPTIASTAAGSHFFVNSVRLSQVQSAVWDHTLGRLRVRLIHWGGDEGQEVVRSARAGDTVDLRLELPDGEVRSCSARVRFCRTRFCLRHVIRTTVEFNLDNAKFPIAVVRGVKQ
jgi:hypothetical protein